MCAATHTRHSSLTSDAYACVGDRRLFMFLMESRKYRDPKLTSTLELIDTCKSLFFENGQNGNTRRSSLAHHPRAIKGIPPRIESSRAENQERLAVRVASRP